MKGFWARIVAFFSSVFLWFSSLFGISAPTPKPPENPGIDDPTPVVTEQVFPAFTAGEAAGAFQSSGSTEIQRFENTTGADFSAYKAALISAGFTVYAENQIENNLFATLVDSKTTVNLSWFSRTGTTRVITEDRGPLFPLSDSCEAACDTLITGMKGETVVASEGMGFIIRLSDGSFCIIDGGMGDPDHVDSNKLMNILLQQKPAQHEKPVIAAWIFTHLHGDHIGVFNCFSLDHHDDVVIERLMYNFPKEEEVAASDSPYMLDNTIYRFTKFKQNLQDFYADVPSVKLHTGNRFSVRNAQFEVLYTLDDYYPNSILNGGMNESSLLLKMTLEGQTVLWTGDFAFNATDLVLREYGDVLSCDILQMAHHGMNGTVPFYALVNPTYAFLPVWAGGQQSMLEREQNQWLVNSEKMQQMIVTGCGTWTIKMPYDPAPGTFERIPTAQTVYPAYPVLLGE